LYRPSLEIFVILNYKKNKKNKKLGSNTNLKEIKTTPTGHKRQQKIKLTAK
jgi:hypothetical protein